MSIINLSRTTALDVIRDFCPHVMPANIESQNDNAIADLINARLKERFDPTVVIGKDADEPAVAIDEYYQIGDQIALDPEVRADRQRWVDITHNGIAA